MNYVFGPVPSRRLGQSLGIDTIPLKTCNWNCVYCQLGRTRPLATERKAYCPAEDIAAEVQDVLAAHKPGEIDWVTFVGSGEPTLHTGIGWLIEQVKASTDIPVAVITNGSLLYQPDVRQALITADAIMPTLDAGTPELHKQINRPHPMFTFDRLVEGMVQLRRQYSGKLWVEVMLMAGLNDTEEALEQLADVLRHVAPDEIHIGLPDRPPVEVWVKPADPDGVLRAAAILGDVARVLTPISGTFDLGGPGDPIEAVLRIITRHPMRQEQLEQALEQWRPGEVDQVLTELQNSGRAQVVERQGVRFWSGASARFPTQRHNSTT